MPIVLLGYRGSGKTTVGKLLADRLWKTFADTDAHLVKAAGRTIREIFAEQGETHFRSLETASLRALLSGPADVIATGGGIVLAEENRQLLREGASPRIYLRCEPAALLKRIEADQATAANRPNLTAAGGLDEIIHLLAVREPLYREVATHELDVTNLSAAECVVRIAAWC